MKLNQIILGVAIAWLAVLTVTIYKGGDRIAYIDVNKLFREYDQTKVKNKELEFKKANIQKEVDSLLQIWQKDLQLFEKNRSILSTKEKELQTKALNKKQVDYENYSRTAHQKILKEEQLMTQSVINEINSYVEDYGQRHKYKIIIGATGDGGLLYADKRLDITEQVLKELNEDYR